ncbi:DNA cytosine methyltransferase [Saccharopolyspora sp. NPDC050389]|uniref:DNA cytosine methyltransferase n=1 Tax=Saccharopolyspora sp. NPDC050389 TaxID=3155516 RepID=UPI0033EEE014
MAERGGARRLRTSGLIGGPVRRFTSLNICAGAGGMAIGLETAGFDPVMLFDEDADACATLRANRPAWDVRQHDLLEFIGSDRPQVLNVDLFAGAPPRVPYSVAGNRRTVEQTRDPFRAAVWLAAEIQPKAILLDNVPALVKDDAFKAERDFIREELGNCGYEMEWAVLDAQRFGVPQRRLHGLIVGMAPEHLARFSWPVGSDHEAPTVGQVLRESMASRGWPGAEEWSQRANEIAPTIVGGAKGRGGADLGPSRTKDIWARMFVNGASVADQPPGAEHVVDPDDRKTFPKLTVEQAADLQGFPADWSFSGRKTSRFRQVGQAVPPALAEAVGTSIAAALAAA